jgi:hypothetical protein
VSAEIDLKTAHTLQQITSLLKNEKNGLSKTKILRTLNASNGELILALEYGYENGLIAWEAGNWIRYKRDYSVPEELFYPVIEKAISDLWQKNASEHMQFFLEKTARIDSKISGPWTRPDFTLVSHRKFAWTIGEEYDVVTFEVKRPDSSNVLAVFEALAHASNATRAYVVFPIGEQVWRESCPDQEARVKDECSRHGVGLILVDEIENTYRATEIIKARKNDIDHERVNRSLSAVMSNKGREKIAGWKR